MITKLELIPIIEPGKHALRSEFAANAALARQQTALSPAKLWTQASPIMRQMIRRQAGECIS